MKIKKIAAAAASIMMAIDVSANAAADAYIPGHVGTSLEGFEIGTKQLVNNVKQYDDIFEDAGRQYGIDPNILAAVCMQESAGVNYSYREDGTEYPAWGIMQIEYTHEKAFAQFGLNRTGTEWTLEDRLDPEKAVPYAAYLLSESLYRYDRDYIKMLQAYNFGETVLNRIIEAKGDDWLSERVNAAKYADNWQYESYGDPEYAEHVLVYYSDRLDNVSAYVTVDGEAVKFNDQYPIIEDGRTLIPIRALGETLGAKVDWDEDDRSVTITRGGTEIELKIGDTSAYVDGAEHELDTAAEILNGRTMVPLRFAAETLGFDVDWDQESRTVTIDA